ncbi:MAG TPA: hypothetical protein VHP33_00835 [Polyangiaceae bacterium]|nr:hypothetical protein [Polyangiaceae bacterium]
MSLLARCLGCLLLLSAVSCGTPSASAASQPKAGRMPGGAHWRGVYQGPYHIVLNIWTQGNRAQGNWRVVGDREGVFTGTVRGNLLVLDWSERELKGKETWAGRGYFVYSGGKQGHPDQIYGEWGEGRKGRANSWWALKRSGDPRSTSETGQIDTDADQQYQDQPTNGCEAGGCDTDTETQ